MDRRIKYTKKIIKETFIELLLKKDITKITVSELCSIADINRATFYRYYLDIYDLLEKLENEFVIELKKSYQEFDSSNELYDYILAMLKACINDKQFVKVLFKTKNSTIFLNEVLEDAYIRCKDKWKQDLEELNEKDAEYATVYLFNGSIGIINYWVQSEFDKEIESIASMIKDLSYYGTRKFIYKK